MKWPFRICAPLALLIAPVMAQNAAPPGPQFVTLGTGSGPLPNKERSGPANAVVVGSDVYLFDVGPGTVRRCGRSHQ